MRKFYYTTCADFLNKFVHGLKLFSSFKHLKSICLTVDVHVVVDLFPACNGLFYFPHLLSVFFHWFLFKFLVFGSQNFHQSMWCMTLIFLFLMYSASALR